MFDVPAGQRQLFLDDHGIASTQNLTRVMHPPAKKGAVIRPDPDDPDNRSIQTRTAPIWDRQQEIWKMWDCSTPADLQGEQQRCAGYYESRDGVQWTRPIVGQIERRGSRENNLIAVRTDGARSRIDLVVYDPADPEPARRYKAAVPNVGFAVSPDGVNWTMLDVPPVKSWDEYNFSLDQQDGLFILTAKQGGKHGRAVWLSTSGDFEHWTEPELIFGSDDLDQQLGRRNVEARFADSSLQHPRYRDPEVYNVDVYNMGVFRYEGLYVGTPAMYHAVGPVPNYPNTDGFHLVQLACSRDLKVWQRVGGREPFIGPSPLGAGAYDLTQIIGPSCPVLRGDELWFYYTGIKYRACWEYVGEYPNGEHVPLPGLDTDTGAICLAVLRRDGFVSLDAADEEGAVITKPSLLSGARLYVNVNAVAGELRAEALDGQGGAVAASEPVKGDQPRARIQWREGGLASLKGLPVSLRFTLRNASFYSFWLED